MKKQIITIVVGLYGLIRLGQILTPLIKSIEWTVGAVIVIPAIGILIFISYNSFTDLYAGSLASDIGSMRQKLMTKVNLNHNIGSSAPDAKSPREREISSDNKVDSLESVNTKHPYRTSQSDKNEQFNIEQTLSDAEEAIDTATAERSEQNFNMAIEAYEQALTHYQTAINGIKNRSTERDKKIEEAIEKTHEDLQAVKEVKKRKVKLSKH